MPNRLADSSSPYLRQHKDNPVDWFPWCEEATAKAKAEDKPIFLSVGYSACHWCHVMEHESFESQVVAEILNEHFVSIKVDREERPDIDQIYMQAVQMLTGSGGWPMSVFMTHDGTPFFAGTYWPPRNKHGRPGFDQVLQAVADTWKSRREEVLQQGREITKQLQVACRGPDMIGEGLDPQWISEADAWLVRNHDAVHGGFGKPPKFPHAIDLSLLVELEQQRPNPTRQKVITTTLDKMARGGIYDHLGGGFARYSVDAKWLVPHFEKMLYDNALLACTYADAYRLWGNEEYAQVLRETLDYVIRDMTNEFGGFCSSEDADSEGVEGKFYVWSLDEVAEVLGAERSQQFCDCYDVTAEGNFEESNILNLPKSIPQFAELRGLELSELESQLAEDRRKLFERRGERVRPGLDDKVLLSWNALMITAMVRGYRALGDGRYLAAAKRGVDFIVRRMRRDDGGLWHTWRGGTPSHDAYLDDVSYFIRALTELFQVESEEQTLKLAIEAAEAMLASFEDPQGGFFFTAETHQKLIARSKDLADSSVPSGNAMAATALIKLSRLTGREDFLEGARSALMACSGVMAASPQAAGEALRASLLLLLPSKEFVLFEDDKTGEGPEPTRSIVVRQQLLQRFEVNAITVVVAKTTASDSLQQVCPLVAERMAVRNKPTLYVCENSVCRLPLVGETALEFLEHTNA